MKVYANEVLRAEGMVWRYSFDPQGVGGFTYEMAKDILTDVHELSSVSARGVLHHAEHHAVCEF